MIFHSRHYMIMLILSCRLFAVNNERLYKMDADLRHLALNHRYHTGSQILSEVRNGQDWIHILAEGADCKSAVLQAGGHINTDLGNRISAHVPVSALLSMAGTENVDYMCLPLQYRIQNDLLTQDVHANQVIAGQAPLSQPYTGKDVIIGIIDTGIDITYPDFQNPDGSTRILSIWDQDTSGTPPSGSGYDFDYGHEWTKTDIDNGLCTHKDNRVHGTHVSATAAGNGRAASQYRGVAPEADIIVVAFSEDRYYGSVDAVNYIYKKAANLGKPCVVNISLGSHRGPHDGSDLESQMLDQIISEASGRALCASAGNEGNDFIHISYQTDADSFYTYIYPDADGLIKLYIRIPNDELNQTDFSVGWDENNFNPFSKNGGPINLIGHTGWYSVQEIINHNDYYIKARNDKSEEIGRVSFEIESKNDSMTVFRIVIEDDMVWDEANKTVQNMELWRFKIWKPDSHMDAWIANNGYTFPGSINDVHYLTPDNVSSVGMPATAHHVISVGASVNRTTFVDQFGTEWTYSNETVGDLAEFSSRGPTADGRIKPEIVAPGLGVISALSADAVHSSEIKETDIIQGGKHVILSGTSMSSPAVAGCIALYLQKYPNATYTQIIQAVTGSVRKDAYTGNALPDNNWGYGKMDVLAMFTGITGIYGPLSSPQTYFLAQNYPNPFNNSTIIGYDLPVSSSVRMTLFNLQGQLIFEQPLGRQSQGRHVFHLNAKSFPNGIYLYSIEAGNWKASRKMVLMK